ncbi:hypothetical protein G6F59_014636 [Rhizopus arrhizus]|nr:hypothetical protein G6F59_014636 [Rhizopus arrhizus]
MVSAIRWLEMPTPALGEIVGGHVLVHDHHVRLDRSQRDGGEVRGLVVGAFRVQDVGDGHGTGRRNADGVAVGRGAHHRLRADAAACADAVFHHYRLSKLAAHFLADQASGDVRVAPCGGRHNQRDGTLGIVGLRSRRGKAKQQGGKAGIAFHDDSRGVESCAIVGAPPGESVCLDQMDVQQKLMVVGLACVGLLTQAVTHGGRAQGARRA